MNLLQTLITKINTQTPELWEKSREYKRGDFIVQPGVIDTNIYFVEEGSVNIYVLEHGEMQVIRFGYTGQVIAALDAYLTSKPTELFLQAIKKTRLKVMTKASFVNFLHKEPEHLVLWNQIVELLVYQLMERERDILTTSPAERYQRVLKRSPHLFQLIPGKYIANYLRMTPETLSRIRNERMEF